MATGRRLRLRLFLDGVEVPVIGARIDIAAGAPAAATIQIVPTDRALEFHPRTMVHLFVLDLVDPPLPTKVEAGKFGDYGEDLEGYKLIFYGLHIAFAYTKDGYQRSHALQCLDASIAWDTTYQFMLTYGPNGSGIMGSPARFVGANVNLFDYIINDPISVVSSLLQSDPKYHEFSNLSGLLAGLVAVCEAVGGIPGSFKGINDFNTVEELRNKMLHQIVADEGDDTSTGLFSRKAFDQWLNNSAGGMGGLMSIRDILNMVMSYIYYGVVPNPAPYYRGGGTATTTETTSSSVLSDSDKAEAAKLEEDIWRSYDSMGIVAEAVSKLWEASPSSMRTAEDAVIDGLIETGGRGWTALNEVSWVIGSVAPDGSNIYSVTADSVRISAAGLAAQCQNLAASAEGTSAFEKLNDANKLFLVSIDARVVYQDPVALLEKCQEYYRAAVNLVIDAAGLTSSASREVEYEQQPRLGTQIFRPDIWFAAPPRCNVMFPEHHNLFSFNRQLLREVTRYNLRTSMELIGPDPLLDYYYYAPDLAGYVDLSGSSYWTESAIIMPHEVHTGIVPKMQHLGEISLYANEAQKAYFNQQAGTDSSLKNSYAQRVAHHNFFRFRFAPRTIQVSGEFNYLPVCGFPMAVMDKALILPEGVTTEEVLAAINEGKAESTLSLAGQELVLPTQFLGTVSSIQHSVDQKGGRTTLVLNYCRAHRTLSGTDDEYLNVRLTEKKLEAGNIATVTFLLAYDTLKESGNEEALAVLKDLTPQDTTAKVGAPQPSDAPQFVLDVTGDTDLGGVKKVGSRGLQGTITELKTDGAITSDANGDRYYGQVALTEQVEDLEGTISTVMPPEEAIRPPWVASLYGNENIGEKVYQPFFGTGSIVDEQMFVSGVPEETDEEGNPVFEGKFSETKYGELEGSVMDLASGTNQESRVVVDPDDPLAALVTSVESREDERPISVAMALDALSVVYGMTRTRGLSPELFAWRYINRPVATLVDVLGDRDFEIDPVTGNALNEDAREGFHSRGVAPLTNLTGLLVDEDGEAVDLSDEDQAFEQISGTGGKEPIAPSLDQRAERRGRVEAYADELRWKALPG